MVKIKIGDTVGTWKVIERLARDSRHYCWKCICVCGAEKTVYSLASKFERCQVCKKQATDTDDDLTDKQFEDWFVVKQIQHGLRKRWLCRCACGAESPVSTHALLSGGSTRCRKCSYRKMQLNGKMSYQRYFSIKKGAALRGIEFSPQLTREYLADLFETQLRCCAISGISLQFAPNSKTVRKGGDTASLDRIDSTKPYEIGNVQWVHKLINIMKCRLSTEQFVKWCRQVVCHQDGTTNSQPPADVTDGWLFGTRLRTMSL